MSNQTSIPVLYRGELREVLVTVTNYGPDIVATFTLDGKPVGEDIRLFNIAARRNAVAHMVNGFDTYSAVARETGNYLGLETEAAND